MNNYGIVIIDTYGRTFIVLFPDMEAVEHYKVSKADMLASAFMWYVVQILERSMAEIAALKELGKK